MRGRTWALAGIAVAAAAVGAALTLGSGGARPSLPLNVFVRPQTAADQAAFIRRRADLRLGPGPASPRIAETAPWGSQILLVALARRGQSISANLTRRSAPFMLAWDQNVTVNQQAAVADGYVTEAHAGGASFPPPGITAKQIATRIVIVVPNDVDRVRFAYPDRGPAQTVTVHGNVAAVQFSQPCCVLEPEMTWYSAGGSVLRRQLTAPTAVGQFGH